MNIPFVSLKTNPTLRQEYDVAYRRVMDRAWYILGEELSSFETELATYCGAKHCIGVGSGTEALHLALLAAGVVAGDEVVTVSHTFIATALAISWTGAIPVFVDVDPLTSNIDPNRIEEAITPRTKVIMPVHLYGRCVDMEAIRTIADKHALIVIEDAAQAIGADFKGKKVGNLADMSCFSFYPTKNLGALGDGGAVSTNNSVFDDKLRKLRNYGQSKKYFHDSPGFNSRLDELQAAFLRVGLQHLDEQTCERRRLVSLYQENLRESLVSPNLPMNGEHVFHLYTILSERRDSLQESLEERGVGTQIHYPRPIHLQTVFAHLPVRHDLSHTERIAKQTLSLPLYPSIPEEHIHEVIGYVNALTG